jgi:hypothetical protein
MGQQQLLLIILGVIIVGIAIAVGISQFGAHSTQANKDGVTSSLVNIAANSYQFKIRPVTMGGGGGAYDNSKGATASYAIPTKMQSDDNGAYTVGSVAAASITLHGVSSINTAYTADCVCDSLGSTKITYSNNW